MTGGKKSAGDPYGPGESDRLALHLVAIFAVAIVILIIIGGVILNEAGKNPPPAQNNNQASPVNPSGGDILYQVSTLDALVTGLYDGVQPVSVLEKHGDFGIGTFDALDGEMIAIDGDYYQVSSDGSVSTVSPSAMVPFASVTFFSPDKTIIVTGGTNISSFTRGIDAALPSKNLIYAIRYEGVFPEMVTMAIPRQEKPYPPLAEAAVHHVIYKLENTSGTVVGFYLPVYMKGVNMPGYHLHYISDDRKSGGHILDFTAPDGPARVMIDQTQDFSISAPVNGDFTGMTFSRDVSEDL